MASVEFRKANKIYPGNVHALHDLSLDIAAGEFLVMVGPSGCGKSTALRLLAGLEEITSGDVLINGEIVNQKSPQQRNIAMVFQNYALYPHMTVRGNLEFPLKMVKAGKKEREQRIQNAAELLGLGGLLERKPGQLSGGQRQRVAMGRAIVRDPAVFLMDEPLSNLDARLRVQIRADIANLQQKMGTTTLYVTHDQVEAMTLGDRVAVLNAGRLLQVETPQELYRRPANIFVADFIGSPGMNLFDALLVKNVQGEPCIKCKDLLHSIPDSVKQNYPQLDEHLNQRIIAGFRPEAFTTEQHFPEQQRLRVTVKTVEPLGHETLLFFTSPLKRVTADVFPLPEQADDQVSESPMVARLQGNHTFASNTSLDLYADISKVHLFDRVGWRL
ncbi:MAG: sn-glycerol-3-phosphate ABC transporter ATP-binding protein UgpC [Pseudomonadota bacterium]